MAQSDNQKHRDGGVSPIAAAMLDRIAELGKGREDRTLSYLSAGAKKSTAERQQLLKQRRKDAGLQRATVWASQTDLDALKAKYPGPRGGIDWQDVVRVALLKR